MTYGYFIWISPNGVGHLMQFKGNCVTCGRSHPYVGNTKWWKT